MRRKFAILQNALNNNDFLEIGPLNSLAGQGKLPYIRLQISLCESREMLTVSSSCWSIEHTVLCFSDFGGKSEVGNVQGFFGSCTCPAVCLRLSLQARLSSTF